MCSIFFFLHTSLIAFLSDQQGVVQPTSSPTATTFTHENTSLNCASDNNKPMRHLHLYGENTIENAKKMCY